VAPFNIRRLLGDDLSRSMESAFPGWLVSCPVLKTQSQVEWLRLTRITVRRMPIELSERVENSGKPAQCG
jgi:hypothetical protein